MCELLSDVPGYVFTVFKKHMIYIRRICPLGLPVFSRMPLTQHLLTSASTLLLQALFVVVGARASTGGKEAQKEIKVVQLSAAGPTTATHYFVSLPPSQFYFPVYF